MKKTLLISLVLFLLSACSLLDASQAPVISHSPALAFAPAQPSPTIERPHRVTPLPATATAVQFQLLPSSTPVPTHTPVATIERYSYGPFDFPPEINPLTGMRPDDLALLNRRPLAIKVTNFMREVRPQWGLSRADHVWEYYLEAGLTRFVGIFYGSDASRVGPIRSGRLFDEHLMRMYKSFLAFALADDRVLDIWLASDLKTSLVVERPENCPPLCRIGSKDNYNTLYADTAALSEYVTGRGSDNGRKNLEGLYFNIYPANGGKPADTLSLAYSIYSYNQWKWDASTGRYLRFQETREATLGEQLDPLYDQLTGEQIAADNLVVLFLPHRYYLKSSSTEIFEMSFTGEGPAYALRDGRICRLQWKREAQDQLVRFHFPEGAPYPFKPGNIWFQVFSDPSTFEEPGTGAFRIGFIVPPVPTPTPWTP